MKVRFYPEKRIDKATGKPFKEGTLFMYVRTGKSSNGRNTIKISTGYKIQLKNWNDEKRELRNGTANKPAISARMSDMESRATDAYNELDKKYRPIPFDILKNTIESRIKNTVQDTQKDFLNVLDEIIALKKKVNRSPLTVAKYSGLKNHLLEFKKEYPRITLSFESVDENFLNKLKDFFTDTKEHANNSVEKYFRVLKTVLQYAVERGYTTNKYFESFQLDLNKFSKEIHFLEMEELMQLYHHDFSNKPSYEKARDIFAFQCFTGVRISDIQKISHDDIECKKVAGVNQYTWHIRTTKTKDLIHLPLNEFALEILEKYKSLDTPLPKMAEQNINTIIKEVCKDVKIERKVKRTRLYANVPEVEHLPLWEFASTHMARRTFITLSLEQGIPVETIMRYTGHKSFQAMKPYIDITEKRKRIEMNRAWSRDRIQTLKVVS